MKKIILFVLAMVLMSGAGAVVGHPPYQVYPGSFQWGNYIFPNGRVGINTLNPEAALHVNADSIIVEDTSPEIIFKDSNDNRYWKMENTDGYYALWYTNDSGITWTNKFTIARDGKIGLGTLTPVSQLHVVETSETSGVTVESDYMEIRDTSADIHMTTTQTYDTYSIVHWGGNPQTAETGAIVLAYDDNETGRSFTRARMDNVGRLVVGPNIANADMTAARNGGSTDPGATNGYRLSVLGDFIVRGNAYKTSGGNTWSIPSDIRLKQNITDISGSLDRLLDLRGVNFFWKNPSGHGDENGVQAGFIAQEVAEVFPEWVNEGNEYMALNIVGYEAYVVEAIRELKTQKDSEIAELRNQNELLRQEICIINPSSEICR